MCKYAANMRNPDYGLNDQFTQKVSFYVANLSNHDKVKSVILARILPSFPTRTKLFL